MLKENCVFKGQMAGKCIPVAQLVFAMLGFPGHADTMPSLMGAGADAVKHTQVFHPGKYHENSFGKDLAEFVIGLSILSRPRSWGNSSHAAGILPVTFLSTCPSYLLVSVQSVSSNFFLQFPN